MTPEEEALAAAKKGRKAAAGWLTRAAKQCEEMTSGDMKTVHVTEYEMVLANFEKRLNIWDKREERVQTLIVENEKENEIVSTADYREGIIRARTELCKAWLWKNPGNYIHKTTDIYQ